MEDKNRIPYKQEFTYKHIRPVRHSRNKTLAEFSRFMDVDASTIGKLERGELKFTPFYQSKFADAIKRLRISGIELASISKILEMKRQRGYK
ncbi:TPA: helix-turn-helix transcriptional regulator [Streptococcus pyogenes]|uniref:helix-turn-helix domain-containing protein n=1 Tax=Priestia megaterium TaxID=1404 RepID=UPI001E60D6F9|nr:helix-turn-helix transcriptional regulator [Priestia megaterium]MCE4093355.1 helix-turn-helix transcriptional regulator [Priestia megaterium]HES8073956.1 helix-turn-helix transcriptional regulator [Streptococcus pyogenes]